MIYFITFYLKENKPCSFPPPTLSPSYYTQKKMSKQAKVKFYSTGGEYGCFSNFSRHSVKMKDKMWRTSEHYFQAMKFENTEYEEDIRNLQTPSQAASMGRRRDLPLRKDWENVKNHIMYEVVAC